MDRLMRFSMPGIAFILGSWLFIYALTGHNLMNKLGQQFLVKVIPVIFSTPFIGLFISSSFHWVIHWRKPKINGKPGPYWFYLPDTLDNNIYWRLIGQRDQPTKYREWRNFYHKYQLLFREKVNKETAEFTSRRWTYCMIHYNNMAALAAAFLCTIGYAWYHRDSAVGPIAWMWTLCTLLTIFYVLAALRLTSVAREDARNVEYAAVMEVLFPKLLKKGTDDTGCLFRM
jgi:hypothetical protein